tara:strand:- start:262 stop:552 length:291 start_codon:yes stop_codon:yes gene_type:complete
MKLTTERLKKLIKEQLEEMQIDEKQAPKNKEQFENLRNLILQVLNEQPGVSKKAMESIAGAVAAEVALYLEKGGGDVIDTVKRPAAPKPNMPSPFE